MLYTITKRDVQDGYFPNRSITITLIIQNPVD